MARFLAIDPDPSGPLVAVASVVRGGIKLERVLAWPDADPPPTAPAALGAKLKEVLKAARIGAAPVLVCLPRDKFVLKDVRHPKAPPAQEPLVVKFQAKKELAGSPDDVLMDYLPTPAPAGADDCRATVVFVNKQVYADLHALCDAAGLKLAAVTPRSFAVAAAYRRAVATAAAHPPEDTAAPVAVLSLTDRGGEFTVIHGTQVPFTRSITAAAVSGEAALVGEVKRNLAAFATQFPGTSVQAIYLAEGSVAGRSWAGRLQTGLPVPVYPFDPTAGATDAAEMPEATRGRFVGAVGLLAARGESEKLPINFVSPRAPKAEPSKARTGLLLAALLLVVVLGGGGVYGYMQKKKKAKEIEDLTGQLRSLEADIEFASGDKKRLAALDDFIRRRVAVPDIIYDLVVLFPTIDPEKMQLVEFAIKPHKTPVAARGPGGIAPKGPPPLPGGPKGPTAPLPGGPAGGLPGPGTSPTPAGAPPDRVIEDITLTILAKDSADIDKFKDTLKLEKRFGKISSENKGSTSGAGDRSQHIVTIEVFSWPRSAFDRKLTAAFPVKPKAADPAADPAAPDPFADPFDIPGGNTP